MVKDEKKYSSALKELGTLSSINSVSRNPNKQKYKLAIGLKYDSNDETPTLSVKGERILADDLVKIAKRYGIPVVEDPKLANTLNQLDLDAQIPSELFRPVAILLNELKRTVSKCFSNH